MEWVQWYVDGVWNEGLGPHGAGTYGTMLASWLMFCSGFEVLTWTGKLEHLRLQKDKISKEKWWHGVRYSMFTWTWLAIALPLASPLLRVAFPTDVPMLSLLNTVKFLLLSMVVFDVWFYLSHRMLHTYPWLYKYHKPHHAFTATFVWMSHAEHPVEVMLNAGALFGPLLWVHVLGPVHLHALWLWLGWLQFFGVMDHSGYDLPINPFFLFIPVPGLTTVKDHDEHHRRQNVAYGAAIRIWDEIAGTSA